MYKASFFLRLGVKHSLLCRRDTEREGVHGFLGIGIKGTVLALDRATGNEVWRTELKGVRAIHERYQRSKRVGLRS